MALTNPVASTTSYFIGIDGGGSKCRATLYNEANDVSGTGLAGPANPVHNPDQAMDAILEATGKALADACLDPTTITELVAGVGLAGVNIPAYHSLMANWSHPFKKMYLTTDLHIACLGAHNGHDGAVIIIGTGSCGFMRHEGTQTTFGGHGFPYGDKGSGAWIGLEAIKSVLLAHDNLGPQTQLTEIIHQHYQLADNAINLAAYFIGKSPADYAKLAPLVFHAARDNDTIAQAIISDGAAYIDKLAKALFTKKTPALALIGGLAKAICPFLSSDVQQRLSTPVGSPEQGALLFARKHYPS